MLTNIAVLEYFSFVDRVFIFLYTFLSTKCFE